MKNFAIAIGILLLFRATASALPDGFVYLEDVAPSIQTDARYATSNNFVGKKVDGYKAKKVIIARRAAEALKLVQADLKKEGYGLKVFDAYRPQRAVNHFMRWVRNRSDQRTKAKYYPNIEKSTLARDGYIAGRSDILVAAPSTLVSSNSKVVKSIWERILISLARNRHTIQTRLRLLRK